jgi:hypothetical protein
MSDNHAILSPSGSIQWYNCEGSLAMQAGEEDKGSIYAEEGTAMHALASAALKENRPAAAYVGRIFKSEEGTDFEVTEEDAEHMQRYLNAINEQRYVGLKFVHELMVEERVLYGDEIGQPDHKAFGTSDAIVIDETAGELIVNDLKWGMGVRVNADENTQLMLYGLGALRLVEPWFRPKQVRLAIHQPRLYHVSEWVIDAERLVWWAHNTARFRAGAALAMLEGRLPIKLTPGEKQCRFCRARASCPEARNVAVKAALEGFDDVTQADAHNVRPKAVDTLPLDELAKAGRLVPFVEDWCRAVTGRIDIEVLKNGQVVPGFKAVTGKAPARTWADVNGVMGVIDGAEVKRELTHEPPKPAELKSPAALEKVKGKLPKGLWEKISEFVFKGKGKPTVVPESDPRPALVIKPEDGFEDVEQDLA